MYLIVNQRVYTELQKARQGQKIKHVLSFMNRFNSLCDCQKAIFETYQFENKIKICLSVCISSFNTFICFSCTKKFFKIRLSCFTSICKYDIIPHSAPTSPGAYATLGRPVSLPVAKQSRHRSSSDPDLPGSPPVTPDCEVAGIMGSKTIDRSGSLCHRDPPYFPKVHGRKVSESLKHIVCDLFMMNMGHL